MKFALALITLAGLGSIGYGYWLPEAQQPLADRCIGAGVCLLFLVAMPLFLYKESRGKKWNDYMLTEDNVRKMQGKEKENIDNQQS